MVYTLCFFSLQNSVCFIILNCLVSVLFKFYIQGLLKLKNNNSDTKRLKRFLWRLYSSNQWPGIFIAHISSFREQDYGIQLSASGMKDVRDAFRFDTRSVI